MLSIIPAQESPVEQPEKVKQSAPKRPRGRPKLTTKQRRARDLATSENLTDQLLFAFRRGNRFFAFGGLLVGGFIPLGSYTLIHQEVAARPYLWALVAGGLLYAIREDGVVFVARVEGKFEILAENRMDERIIASPVAVSDRLLIRGERQLFCITGR